MPSETRDLTPHEAIVLAGQLDDAGRGPEAEGLLRGVLVIEPDNFHAHNRLGICLVNRKSYYEALYRFNRAIKIKPTAMVISNRGMVLSELGHCDEAMLDFETALRIDDKNPIFWNNLGNTRERLGLLPGALEALTRSIELDPDHALSYHNRGTVMIRLNRHGEALEDFERALAIDPVHTGTVYNRGVAKLNLNDHRAALADFERGLALNPAQAETLYNRGVTRLCLGDFGGFADYEARLLTADCKAPYLPADGCPQWHGEDFAGKSLLLHAEQGIGDAIQFIRYLPQVAARGGTVKLVVHTPIEELVKATYGDLVEMFPWQVNGMLPTVDLHCPLMSLPAIFRTGADTIPPPALFKFGSAKRWDDSISRMAGADLRVGLCWSGNFQHKNDLHRSIPVVQFASLLGVEGASIFSLQKDVRPIDAEDFAKLPQIRALAASFQSFTDTAQALSCLDLVITVDTSVAHLAGSLGVPTWVLIPAYGCDWRWGLEGETTPWYPSMRLFRQSTIGDWSDTIARVRADLATLAAGKTRQVA